MRRLGLSIDLYPRPRPSLVNGQAAAAAAAAAPFIIYEPFDDQQIAQQQQSGFTTTRSLQLSILIQY